MNRIITTSIVDPAIQQPLTGKSLDFLQNAGKSILLGLAQSIIGESYDNTKAYILKGLDAYGTNQYHEGYILYGGEVYYCAGKATTTAFSNLPIMTITVTNDATADPVEFTDLVSRNVHNNRTIVLSDGLTGTGTFDLSDAIYVQSTVKTKIIDLGDWNMNVSSGGTGTHQVAHGLAGSLALNIISINVIIRPDVGVSITPPGYGGAVINLPLQLTTFGTGLTHGGIAGSDGTNIKMAILTGGIFDSVSFNATSYSRGWVYITYKL